MASWSSNGKPAWLNEDDAATSKSSPASSSRSLKGDVENPATSSSKQSTRMGSNADTRPTTHYCSTSFTILSLIFLGAFSFAVYYCNNQMAEHDASSSLMDTQWIGYYYFQIAIICLSLITRMCSINCCKSLASSMMGIGMVWSIVLVSIATKRYQNNSHAYNETSVNATYVTGTNSSSPTDEVDVISANEVYVNLTNYDEYAIELTTSILGFVSCCYHLLLVSCCSSSSGKVERNADDFDNGSVQTDNSSHRRVA